MALYDANGNAVFSEDNDIYVVTSKCPALYITSDTAYEDVPDAYINGSLKFVDNGATKFSIPIEFKLQGHSSIMYPKHNFKIKFYKADNSGDKQKIYFNDWYGIKKCVIKANYRDYSQGINSITAQIIQDWLTSNYPCNGPGVIMSFPCLVYYNGEFMGTHSFNTDQDGDTYGFSKKLEKNLTQGAWRNINNGGMSLITNWEYKGSEDITDISRFAVVPELFAAASDHELTKAEIEAVLDKDSLLNYMMFTQILLGLDRWNNNLTFVTWNGGETWWMPFYDMDTSLEGGSDSDFISPDNPDLSRFTFWRQVATLYEEEYPTYYAKLRNGGLTAEKICKRYNDYILSYGLQNYDADAEKWYSAADRVSVAKRIARMKSRFESRINYLDTLYNYRA